MEKPTRDDDSDDGVNLDHSIPKISEIIESEALPLPMIQQPPPEDDIPVFLKNIPADTIEKNSSVDVEISSKKTVVETQTAP